MEAQAATAYQLMLKTAACQPACPRERGAGVGSRLAPACDKLLGLLGRSRSLHVASFRCCVPCWFLLSLVLAGGGGVEAVASALGKDVGPVAQAP